MSRRVPRWVYCALAGKVVLVLSAAGLAWIFSPALVLAQSEVIPCALPSGQVVVIVPAPNYVNDQLATGLTRAQVLEAISQKDAPAGAVCGPPVDRATLPDRRFRNAWRSVGGAVSVDWPAAREIRAQELQRVIYKKLDKSVADEAALRDVGGHAQAELHRPYRTLLRRHVAALSSLLHAATTLEALGTWTPAYPADPSP